MSAAVVQKKTDQYEPSYLCFRLKFRTNNKGDIGTFKVRYVGYFGSPWMTLN